jgi:MFS family permease
MLMISRLIQAFGGGIGSVIGQAICRDVFHGAAAGKAFSAIGSSLAIFPALGPIIGGVIAQQSGWPNIFLFLIIISIILIIAVLLKLPETHLHENRNSISLLKVALVLLKDKKVLAFALIVGISNGIVFSYFAEGPFYLIEILGLTPSQFGLSFFGIAFSSMAGGMYAKKLTDHKTAVVIVNYGLMITLISTFLFSVCIIIHSYILQLPAYTIITFTILSHMASIFGITMAVSNALSICLVQYKSCVGTASSLFGFFYYSLISLFTLGMGYLHNGTLLPMPLYFFGLALGALLVKKLWIREPN